MNNLKSISLDTAADLLDSQEVLSGSTEGDVAVYILKNEDGSKTFLVMSAGGQNIMSVF